MSSAKPAAGGALPSLSFPKVGGGSLSVGGVRERWALFVVYRGKHCGRCKKYLTLLEGMKGDWETAGFDIVVVSADPQEKAQADITEFGWSFDIGYGLTEAQMQELGLYISHPRSPEETDKPFSEPGMFAVNAEGKVHLIDISNTPFHRADLNELLETVEWVKENDYPIRRTYE